MTHGTDQSIGTGKEADQDLSQHHSHEEKILQISVTSNRSARNREPMNAQSVFSKYFCILNRCIHTHCFIMNGNEQ